MRRLGPGWNFRSRLVKAKEISGLTVADLVYWFERPYSTVWYWTNEDRTSRTDGDREERLTLLEACGAFPIPPSVSQKHARADYVRNAYVAALRGVSQDDTAGSGAKVRCSSEREAAAAKVLLDKLRSGGILVKARCKEN